MRWHTYILECADDSFYVGHTENLKHRVDTHNAGQGAAFTKHRRPVELVYSEPHDSKTQATAREKQIKKWARAKKQGPAFSR